MGFSSFQTPVVVLTGGGSGVAFYVDGKTIPDVDWDVGPSWAGLLPISGSNDETRKVRACFVGSL